MVVLLGGCDEEKDIKVPTVPDTNNNDSIPDTSNPAAMIESFGVNLSGGEFGGVYPGVIGTHYGYPTYKDLDYFKGKN